ncbi:hypothetical protein H9P43_008005 [Blastocladiella emersonii ATCC 22665]|nr:hypothetical protein H9P43_008005 [Blastocladiella emersonii ATCC 22665]
MSNYSITESQRDLLVAEAVKAKEFSYSPYSKFRVGAAILMGSGKVYTGCNIESAAYSPTTCAERCALVKAVSEGDCKLIAVAITSDLDDFCAPCGVCRQFLSEFGLGAVVILTKVSGEVKQYAMRDLLPLAFGPEDLAANNKDA